MLYFEFYIGMAYNDPNNDGVVSLQREVGQNIIVVTVFAMQI